MKVATTDATKNYDILEGKDTILDPVSHCANIQSRCSTCPASSRSNTPVGDTVGLTKVHCILATKSTEAVINGNFLKFGKVIGFPASFYTLVQQLVCLD